MTRALAVPFAGTRVTAADPLTWLRLTGAGAVLFGPGRAALLSAARNGNRRRLHAMERRWASAARRALDIRIDKAGFEHVDPTRQYVVTPLHEGFADVLCLLQLPLDLSFAARDDLFEWRILGPYLEASGQARIPTQEGAAAYRSMYRGAERAFAADESFVVFPQGTILGIEAAFQPGAFRIAQRLGAPVLPVVITGTHRVWEHPYSPTVRTGVEVTIEVLAPIPPDQVAEAAPGLERDMKQRALSSPNSPRRFDPDRDGWWDDYPYEIDPSFPDLADRVAEHRA